MVIRVCENIGDGFGESIKEIFRIIKDLAPASPPQKITIDFSQCKFIHPFVFIGLKLIQNQYTTQGYQIEFNLNCNDSRVSNYISTVCFPDCLKPINYVERESLVNKYANKSYLPLVAYDTLSSNKKDTNSNGLISLVDELLKKQLKLPQNLLSGLRYLIDEAQDNIREHSASKDGYIIAQFFKEKKYLDLCIADDGIGLLGSYQNNGNYAEVDDDIAAMKYATTGKSTKGKERGYGISTSLKLLTEGLNGNYFLWSGKAFFFNGEVYKTPDLPINRLGGTILFLRIPMINNDTFDYRKFTE